MKGLEIIHFKELGMKRSFSEAGKTLFPRAHACMRGVDARVSRFFSQNNKSASCVKGALVLPQQDKERRPQDILSHLALGHY